MGMRIQMARKRVGSIKWGLFIHLIIAFLLATICSIIVNTIANSIQDKIWIKYVNDISGYYEIYNDYSEQFGGVVSIPQTEVENLSKMDAVLIEICDFSITWCGLIFTIGFVFISLTRFYKKRLKKPLILLENSAERISNQDLNFSVEYQCNDEMGKLCNAFEKMREQLYINNKTMWKVIDEQKQMRSAFSHDLRTPMSVLKGYVEYLGRYFPQDKLSKEKVIETIDDLNEQIVRIEKFADTMKEINHIEEMQPQKTYVNKSIIEKKTEAIIKALVNNQENTYKMSCLWTDSEYYLDLDMYQEIVENIVANAVRFSKSKIGIELCGDNNKLSIVVYDDGPGFKDGEIIKAKKPYYHGVDKEGTHYGMGLYISDTLCKKHGGNMSLNNLSTGGAYVKIVLENVS